MAINWSSEGRQSRPAPGALLADTGPLPGPNAAEIGFLISHDGHDIATVLIQRRNAANTETLQEVSVDIAGGHPFDYRRSINLENDERVRVLTSGVVKGEIQATIFEEL